MHHITSVAQMETGRKCKTLLNVRIAFYDTETLVRRDCSDINIILHCRPL